MKKKKVLNAYAGIGGNRKLWGDEYEVTAIELEPKIAETYKNFFPKDIVIVTDAHQYILDHAHEFDIVWSSPPCQTHSRMMKATRHPKKRYSDMSLYQEILFLTHFYKGLFVVENVKPYYDPLIKPTQSLGRHLFWSNFEISPFFTEPNFKNFITSATVKETEELKKWLGLIYEGNLYYKGNHDPGQILRNCVHPEMGLHVFKSI